MVELINTNIEARSEVQQPTEIALVSHCWKHYINHQHSSSHQEGWSAPPPTLQAEESGSPNILSHVMEIIENLVSKALVHKREGNSIGWLEQLVKSSLYLFSRMLLICACTPTLKCSKAYSFFFCISIKFVFFYIAPFTIKLSLGPLQRQKPKAWTPGKQSGKEKFPFNRKKPWAYRHFREGTGALSRFFSNKKKKTKYFTLCSSWL